MSLHGAVWSATVLESQESLFQMDPYPGLNLGFRNDYDGFYWPAALAVYTNHPER
jgi:hypothetical protein